MEEVLLLGLKDKQVRMSTCGLPVFIESERRDDLVGELVTCVVDRGLPLSSCYSC